jgi:hypothetical protein
MPLASTLSQSRGCAPTDNVLVSARSSDVGLWYETDLPRCPQFGRYRGESGRGGYERRLPKLTAAVEKGVEEPSER